MRYLFTLMLAFQLTACAPITPDQQAAIIRWQERASRRDTMTGAESLALLMGRDPEKAYQDQMAKRAARQRSAEARESSEVLGESRAMNMPEAVQLINARNAALPKVSPKAELSALEARSQSIGAISMADASRMMQLRAIVHPPPKISPADELAAIEAKAKTNGGSMNMADATRLVQLRQAQRPALSPAAELSQLEAKAKSNGGSLNAADASRLLQLRSAATPKSSAEQELAALEAKAKAQNGALNTIDMMRRMKLRREINQ